MVCLYFWIQKVRVEQKMSLTNDFTLKISVSLCILEFSKIVLTGKGQNWTPKSHFILAFGFRVFIWTQIGTKSMNKILLTCFLNFPKLTSQNMVYLLFRGGESDLIRCKIDPNKKHVKAYLDVSENCQ